jgi:hypothetical protein
VASGNEVRPVDDEGTLAQHLLAATEHPEDYLAVKYRHFDPNNPWPNQNRSRNSLHKLGMEKVGRGDGQSEKPLIIGLCGMWICMGYK